MGNSKQPKKSMMKKNAITYNMFSTPLELAIE